MDSPMWKARLALVLVLAMTVTLIPVAPVRAQAVQVLIDGSPVIFDQPPVVVGGRVLVPLRGVFERLGAFVQWNPANNSVLASRGSTQVQLTIGSRQAFVNGRQVLLDVPAMIVGGRTLVPLRFVSEAMGARVDWDPASRTVMIFASPLVQPPSPPPVVQPPQPPVPGQSVIDGTVFRVDLANQRLFVQRGDQIHTVVVTANTAITRVNTATGQGGAVSLADVRVGDHVTVTLDAQGRAILVRVQVREVSGRIDAIAGRTIVLSTGQVLTLADDARIVVGGRETTVADLRVGMDVTLRLNPQTNQVVEVTTQAVAQPPGQVRITSFTHNVTRPLRAEETIVAELRGTAGGQATFDIFGIAQGVAMQEVSPGVYRGTYRVRAGDNVLSAALFGHLRVGGQQAVPVQAGTLITIDTRAPVIRGRFPEPNAVINNTRPNIVITFDDEGGSGVNPGASTIIVNGQNVTARATVTETAIAYAPPEALAQGTVAVQVRLRDRAGNETASNWSFSIGVATGSLIQAVTVNPPTPLVPGQVVTVTAIGQAGGRATFSVEGLAGEVAMTETQPGLYVGQFTVRPEHVVANARVFVTLTVGFQTSRVEATSRLTVVGQQAVAPTITSPAAGTRVGAPIVIRGTAPPGSTVIVRVDYQGTLLFFSVRGTYGQVSTTADAAGNWQISINPSPRIPNATLTITAVAVDSAGRQSASSQVQVTQN